VTNTFIFSNYVTFSWTAVTDPDGGIASYHVRVGTTPGGSDVTNVWITGTSLTVAASYGAHLYATVTAVNNAGIEGTAVTSSSVALLNPSWVPVASLPTKNQLQWNSASGLVYKVLSTTNLTLPFTPYSGTVTAAAPTVNFPINPTNTSRYFKVQMNP
jgi:hypothetical protein